MTQNNIIAIFLCLTLSFDFAYSQNNKFNNLNQVSQNGVIYYEYFTTNADETLKSISEMDNRLNLDTLLFYNKKTAQNQKLITGNSQKPENIKLKENTRIIYPKNALGSANGDNIHDTTTYKFTIINKNDKRENHRTTISNLKSIENLKYAVRITGNKLEKINVNSFKSKNFNCEDALLIPEVYTTQEEGTEDLIDLEICVWTTQNMQFNREKGSFEGKFLVKIKEVGDTLIQSQPKAIPYAIELRFDSDNASFNPKEIELDKKNLIKTIYITDNSLYINPVKIVLNAENEYEYSIYKQPVVNIETQSNTIEGIGPQSIQIRLSLLGYTSTEPATVNLIESTGNRTVSIIPSTIQIPANSYSEVILKSDISSEVTIKASSDSFLSDSKIYIFNIKTPTLKIDLPSDTIEGNGELTSNFTISSDYNGPDSLKAQINFKSSNSSNYSFNPMKFYLKRNMYKSVELTSRASGRVSFTVSADYCNPQDTSVNIIIHGPWISISKDKDTIEGIGIESKDVIVSLNNYSGKDEVRIDLSINNAIVKPDVIYLSAETSSKKVKIKSIRTGLAILEAKTTLPNIEPGKGEYVLKFPLMFMIFSLLGGLVGALIRIFMKIENRKIISTLLYGSIIGFIVAIFYIVLNINLFTLEIEPTYSGFLVLGISILGTIFWETIYTSLSKYITK